MCHLGIPLRQGVPVKHVYDAVSASWDDDTMISRLVRRIARQFSLYLGELSALCHGSTMMISFEPSSRHIYRRGASPLAPSQVLRLSRRRRHILEARDRFNYQD